MRFTDSQIEVLKSTSMRDILAVEGYDTSHTSGGLFFSPFRGRERTPSFHIDDINHRWYDHGNAADAVTGHAGGDVISFVRQLKGLDFPGALEYLCRYNPSVVPELSMEPVTVPEGEDRIVGDAGGAGGTTFLVDGASPSFHDRKLIRYAEESRCIPRRFLEAACREVNYRVLVTDYSTGELREYPHNAIGFSNVGGGWALRYVSRHGKDKGKRSTGGGYSAIDKFGKNMVEATLAASSPSVVVFEGFMDYVSWLVLYRFTARPEDTDVVVLNSVSNLRQALPFILQHGNVIGILDADQAGDVATDALRGACEDAESPRRFVDARKAILREHKDVNDRLVAERQGDDKKQTIHKK